MSRRELAIYAKIGHSEAAYIESGLRIPNVFTAIRIAKVLKVTVEELFIE